MIPTKPPPTLKDPNKFSSECSDFISRCLVKNPEERPSATALLQQKFVKSAKPVAVLKDLVQYAQRIVEEEEDSGSDVSIQHNSIPTHSAFIIGLWCFLLTHRRERITMSSSQLIIQWCSRATQGRGGEEGEGRGPSWNTPVMAPSQI